MIKIIYFILILSPLPFASARPIWMYTFTILVSIIGVIFFIFSRPKKNRQLPKLFYFPVASLLFLTLMGGMQVLFGWSVAPESTIRTSVYALSYLVFFLLVFMSIKNTQSLPRFFRTIGLIVTVYCAYGLIIYFSGNEKILWFDKWTSLEGLTSTFVNRNHFAAYAGIGMNCLIAYSFWLFATTNTDSINSKSRLFDFCNRHLTQVMALSLSFVIVFTALLLTGSRAGIISAIIAITYLTFGLYFHSKSRSSRHNKIVSLIKFLPIFLICLSAMFLLSGDLLVDRLNSGLVDNYRLETYSLIVHLIENGSLYGTGLGSFPEVFSQHRMENLHVLLLRAHNDYLEILLTAGPFVGGILLSFLLLFLFKSIFDKPLSSPMSPFSIATTSSMIQLALHSSVDFPLQIPAIAITMCGIIGANAILLRKHPTSK